MKEYGWFVDYADEEKWGPNRWEVCLQNEWGIFPLEVGFMSREDAEGFIDTQILGKGRYESQLHPDEMEGYIWWNK